MLGASILEILIRGSAGARRVPGTATVGVWGGLGMGSVADPASRQDESADDG